jgi:hypothetical protein
MTELISLIYKELLKVNKKISIDKRGKGSELGKNADASMV